MAWKIHEKNARFNSNTKVLKKSRPMRLSDMRVIKIIPKLIQNVIAGADAKRLIVGNGKFSAKNQRLVLSSLSRT